jgi:hypothetical protein
VLSRVNTNSELPIINAVVMVPRITERTIPSETVCEISLCCPRACAFATIDVVAMVKKENIIDTNMKMVVLGPSAASPMDDI